MARAQLSSSAPPKERLSARPAWSASFTAGPRYVWDESELSPGGKSADVLAAPCQLMRGTRSGSGCRCRSRRAWRRATRRASGSPSWARSARGPSSRAGCVRARALALAAADGRRVLVAVVAVLGRIVLQQPVAARVGAGTVDHQPSRPAPADGVRKCLRMFGYSLLLNTSRWIRRGFVHRLRVPAAALIAAPPPPASVEHGHGRSSQ